MGWKVESMENQKQQFILLYKTGKFTMTSLCDEFGISRPTGYSIVKRYDEEGWKALTEHSRKHQKHPFETDELVQERIVKERKKHKFWGARKIRNILIRDNSIRNEDIPSETTVNNILKRNGLVKRPRNTRRKLEAKKPIFDPQAPNEIWSIDFKGKFKMGNMEYCHPLTLTDSNSRYLFAISGLENPNTEGCRPVLIRVFREWGIPDYMHSDNGPPFGNVASLRRMTRLSVWLMELGITPVYSDPASPQQNGRHERMHRDLKAEVTRPAGYNMSNQQYKFDKFRKEYNEIRPHEALDMKTPAEVHVKSEREYPRYIEEWDYGSGTLVKLVTVNGAVRWNKNTLVVVSTALSGKYVGFKELDTGLWEVSYRHVTLGVLDEHTMRIVEDYDLNL